MTYCFLAQQAQGLQVVPRRLRLGLKKRTIPRLPPTTPSTQTEKKQQERVLFACRVADATQLQPTKKHIALVRKKSSTL